MDTRAITENLKREIDATIRKMSNASLLESNNNQNQYYFDANNNLTENKPAPTSRMQYGSAGAAVTTSPSSSVTPPPSYGETRQSTPAETNEYNILPHIDAARDIEMRGMRNRTDGNSGRNVFEISYL